MSDLSGIRALTFDVFGTVVDWREGVARDVADHLPALDAYAVADRWRDGYQPAMEAVRNGSRPWVPLDVLHREILLEILAEEGLEETRPEVVDALNLAWHRLDPWPDVLAGMDRLRTRFILGVLSNANIGLMTDMDRRAGMVFDCMLGGEAGRAYKPMPQAYDNAAKILGLRTDQCLMVAAHDYDLDAAAERGMRTAYVHRPKEHGPATDKPRPAQGRFDIMVDSFGDLAAALGC